MFTGIIEARGRIEQIEHGTEDRRMFIDCGDLSMEDVALGDSIAVNGVCLTATTLGNSGFWADVSAETLSKTTLKQLQVGTRVNLEKALTPSTRLGGHLVSGHVDGLGEVVSRKPAARSVQFRIRAPDELAKYIAPKGSICVDGISLTVNAVEGAVFDLNIVPHTLQMTTLDERQPGDVVNLEVDIIARYLERLLLGDDAAAETASAGITRDFLAQHGFIK
jgi:riboflavin synthase